MSEGIRNTVIIGSGPAGLTAGIYAARANLKPLILAGSTPGGQLTKTSEVENFPGFKKGINGPELMYDMMEQVKFCGGELVYEAVDSIETSSRPFTINYGGGKTVKTHTLIFATGASPRWLGLPSEARFMPPHGSGVTSCAVCDGSFYRKMPVIVVGGGDSAMEEANYLAKMCSSVTLVHRREEFRASKIMLDRARANPVIKWELNSVVDEILGDTSKKLAQVNGVRLKNIKDGTTKTLSIAAVFVAIGHIPTTSLLKGHVEMDSEGYIIANDRQMTSVPGLFAAGDCHDRRYRQAITAAGMGCKAALEAERYLVENNLG